MMMMMMVMKMVMMIMVMMMVVMMMIMIMNGKLNYSKAKCDDAGVRSGNVSGLEIEFYPNLTQE